MPNTCIYQHIYAYRQPDYSEPFAVLLIRAELRCIALRAARANQTTGHSVQNLPKIEVGMRNSTTVIAFGRWRLPPSSTSTSSPSPSPPPYCCSPQTNFSPLHPQPSVGLLKTMFSAKIQGVLALTVVGIAVSVRFALGSGYIEEKLVTCKSLVSVLL